MRVDVSLLVQPTNPTPSLSLRDRVSRWVTDIRNGVGTDHDWYMVRELRRRLLAKHALTAQDQELMDLVSEVLQ